MFLRQLFSCSSYTPGVSTVTAPAPLALAAWAAGGLRRAGPGAARHRRPPSAQARCGPAPPGGPATSPGCCVRGPGRGAAPGWRGGKWRPVSGRSRQVSGSPRLPPRLRGSAPACLRRGGGAGAASRRSWGSSGVVFLSLAGPRGGMEASRLRRPGSPVGLLPSSPPGGAGRRAPGRRQRQAGGEHGAPGRGCSLRCRRGVVVPGGVAGRGGSCGREPGRATRVAAARLAGTGDPRETAPKAAKINLQLPWSCAYGGLGARVDPQQVGSTR